MKLKLNFLKVFAAIVSFLLLNLCSTQAQNGPTCDTYTNVAATVNTGLGNNTVNKVYASGSTIYAATQQGLSISTDGGSTFSNHCVI